jgi:PAS domain S-box-containing protein
MEDEKFYSDMSALNNELINVQRQLIKKNSELERINRELKASEDALRESQRLFSEVANFSPALFWMSGMEKLRVWFNQSWLVFTGRSLAEETGNGWTADIYPPDLQDYLDLYYHSFEAQQPFTIEYRLRHLGGEYRWFYDQGSPRYDAAGNFAGFIGFCVDISERKQAEAKALEIEALQKISKAKSELLTNVSHELRTPLSSIKGFIETLLEKDVKWSRKQQLDFLTSANRESDHLIILVSNLLDMSRIESGTITLNQHFYTFEALLESADARLKQLTLKHKLVTDIPTGRPPFRMDIVRLAQVVTNLVENAVKFSEPGSTITIQAKIIENEVIMRVVDQGKGISTEYLGQLFDRFFQVENAFFGKAKGIGLGLAICKGIIEAHGGKIWVESEPHKGSRFSFSIPFQIEAPD